MSRIILHIDLDAFFCRAEEIKNPSLEGKAFIVGGEGRRGIVSTCSYKAREYGIHSGMPTFQAKMLCKNVLVLPADFRFYDLLSREFINYLKQYSNKIQQASIDECFLDFTDYYNAHKNVPMTTLLKNIQQGLFKKTSLKCSIGVGTTKFIAKMASDYQKPMGITIIRNRDIHKMLFPLPIEKYFGIGKKTSAKLREININTIGDLYNTIKTQGEVPSIHGQDILDELDGKTSNQINDEHIDPKSIGMSRTLDSDTNNETRIIEVLKHEIQMVVSSMIEQNMFTKTISISMKDAAHETNFKAKSFSYTFDEYTDDLEFITKEAIDLFKRSYRNEVIRLIGFTVKNIKEKHGVVKQMTFEDFQKHEKENNLYLLVNELNRESHKQLFKRASDILKDE